MEALSEIKRGQGKLVKFHDDMILSDYIAVDTWVWDDTPVFIPKKDEKVDKEIEKEMDEEYLTDDDESKDSDRK